MLNDKKPVREEKQFETQERLLALYLHQTYAKRSIAVRIHSRLNQTPLLAISSWRAPSTGSQSRKAHARISSNSLKSTHPPPSCPRPNQFIQKSKSDSKRLKRVRERERERERNLQERGDLEGDVIRNRAPTWFAPRRRHELRALCE